MFRSGLVDMLVTHANKEGFGLTPLSGDRRGYMLPLLKTKNKLKKENVLLIYKDMRVYKEFQPIHFRPELW